jgi:hypothetical protein
MADAGPADAGAQAAEVFNARRVRTACANCCSSGAVSSQQMQASVIDWPYSSG